MKQLLASQKWIEIVFAIILSIVPTLIAWDNYSPISFQGIFVFVLAWIGFVGLSLFIANKLSKAVDVMCES